MNKRVEGTGDDRTEPNRRVDEREITGECQPIPDRDDFTKGNANRRMPNRGVLRVFLDSLRAPTGRPVAAEVPVEGWYPSLNTEHMARAPKGPEDRQNCGDQGSVVRCVGWVERSPNTSRIKKRSIPQDRRRTGDRFGPRGFRAER